VRYTRVDQFTVPAVMGRRVDDGVTAEGAGDGEGVIVRVGLGEGVAATRTASGGPEDDVLYGVGAWEQAASTAATTTATILIPDSGYGR
jgi:hypothetical protein